MEVKEKIAVVHRYVEAFEKADLGIIREMYAADGRVEDPVGTDAHEGIEAICAFYQGALGNGVKLALTGEPRCAGNAVAFPFQAKMPGITIDVIDVFEFDQSGKVSSMRAYWGKDNMVKG